MKNKWILIFSAVVGAILGSCNFDADTDEELYSKTTIISAYPSSVSYAASGLTAAGDESQTVIITLNPKQNRNMDWRASVDQTWCKLTTTTDNSSGVEEKCVIVTAEANTEYRRSATLLIECTNGEKAEFPIVQLGAKADAALTVSVKSMEFIAELPDAQQFSFITNMGDVYSITPSVSWIHTSDKGSGVVEVSVDENLAEGAAERSGEIKVTIGSQQTSYAEVVIPVVQLKPDVYLFIWGSATVRNPTAASAPKMTKTDEGKYTIDAYFNNGQVIMGNYADAARYPQWCLGADGKLIEMASTATTPVDAPAFDIAGMRTLYVNLNDMTYTMDRLSTKNCLPDSEVASYATTTITANGRAKVWMRTALNWNGGSGIGTMKLGSRMVAPANNVGGYTHNLSSTDNVRTSDYDEVESGGKAQGEVEMSAKYGRIYTLNEFLTGTPTGALDIYRLLTDWPEPYHPGTTFVDAVGKSIPMESITSLAGLSFESTPTLSMQIQGICPYGWHAANVQDFYDMLCAAAAAKGVASKAITDMLGTWAVPDVLRSAEGWGSAPVRHAAADAFGFDYFPQGRRLFNTGYQYYGLRGEMFIVCPGAKTGLDVYQSWRVAAMTYNAANLTVNTTYNIGDCAASFRCVKNYE